jgi:glycosyltransferase domain-containing protein
VSLVVPTRGRPHFVSRLLRYLAGVGWPHPILLADSSTPADVEANVAVVASAGGLHVRHETFPPDMSFFLKMAHAASLADTAYVAVSGDDDFIVPRTVMDCAAFLDAHPDYSAAYGREIRVFFAAADGDAPVGLSAFAKARPANESSDAVERLRRFFDHPTSTFYSVYRRASFVRALRAAYDGSLDDDPFREFLVSCLVAAMGKTALRDGLSFVAQVRHPTSTVSGAVTWSSLAASNDWDRRYARFRETLSAELAPRAGMDPSALARIIDTSFTRYLAATSGARDSSAGDPPKREPLAVRARRRIAGAVARVRHRADEWSVESLLHPQSPFHDDFAAVHAVLTAYPYGCR